MKKYKVSLIITVYNTNPKYLLKCLESALNQTMPKSDYEIIIVDDCSDNLQTLNVIKSAAFQFPDFVKLITLPKNHGTPSAGRNKGIEIAEGEYIYIADSDDIISLWTLEISYKIAKQAELDVLFFLHYNGLSDYDINAENKEFFSKQQFSFDVYRNDFFYVHCFVFNQLIRRDLLIENSIKFNEKLFYAEDVVFSVMVNLYAKKFGYINDFIFYHRVTDDVSVGGFEGHLGKQLKTGDYFAAQELLKEILAANVPEQRKADYILNCWGCSDVYKHTLETIEKNGDDYSLGYAYGLVKDIPPNILKLLPEKEGSIVKAVLARDANLWKRILEGAGRAAAEGEEVK